MNDPQAKVFPAPVDWDELYPGRFLKAGEFKGQKVTLRITLVRIEELIGDKGPQIKGVIGFEKTEKQLALNKTNGICLRAMFGRLVQQWVGKRVTLFAGMWNGEEAIRVWGSPDIAADAEVVIALPRKRPFTMVMHKMVPKGYDRPNSAGSAASNTEASGGSASGNGNTGPVDPPPADQDAIALLRAPADLEGFTIARKALWRRYAVAERDVPLDVEAFSVTQREFLESQQ